MPVHSSDFARRVGWVVMSSGSTVRGRKNVFDQTVYVVRGSEETTGKLIKVNLSRLCAM